MITGAKVLFEACGTQIKKNKDDIENIVVVVNQYKDVINSHKEGLSLIVNVIDDHDKKLDEIGRCSKTP
jgi:hypothetical protein